MNDLIFPAITYAVVFIAGMRVGQWLNAVLIPAIIHRRRLSRGRKI